MLIPNHSWGLKLLECICVLFGNPLVCLSLHRLHPCGCLSLRTNSRERSLCLLLGHWALVVAQWYICTRLCVCLCVWTLTRYWAWQTQPVSVLTTGAVCRMFWWTCSCSKTDQPRTKSLQKCMAPLCKTHPFKNRPPPCTLSEAGHVARQVVTVVHYCPML